MLTTHLVSCVVLPVHGPIRLGASAGQSDAEGGHRDATELTALGQHGTGLTCNLGEPGQVGGGQVVVGVGTASA